MIESRPSAAVDHRPRGSADPASSGPAGSMDPPRHGSVSEFAALRALLADARFTVADVCRRTGIASIYDFRSLREGRAVAGEIADRLDLFIRIFMDVELVPWRTVEALLSADEARLLASLQLLSPYEADRDLCHATVLLYPTEGLWIVSDLNVSPAGPRASVLPEDAVYPAITRNTRHFLSFLPTTPCDALLELCAGTGIAALLASRYARHTWAADITVRATRFARFNAALNDIGNCTAVQGDLYEPVQGRWFDRIVAHPPYMPSLEPGYIFRDGGEDGEQITRRVVEGLPDHLAKGGRFYCTCMLSDRAGARAEQRVRSMLGGQGADFDVLVVVLQVFPATEYYYKLALAGRATLDEVARRHEVFTRLQVEQLVYCSIVIQRHAAERAAFTCRRQEGRAAGAAAVDWLLRWESAVAESDPGEWLLSARPRVSPSARLRLGHARRDGIWEVEECTLATDFPFAVEAKCPPWVELLTTQADGRRSTRELLESLTTAGVLPREAPPREFARLVQSLTAGGFLEVAEHPLPQAG